MIPSPSRMSAYRRRGGLFSRAYDQLQKRRPKESYQQSRRQ